MRPWLTDVNVVHSPGFVFPEQDGFPTNLWRRVQVYLNGVQMRDVVYANIKQGYIIRDKRDTAGRLVLSGNGWARRIEQEELHGRVQLVDRTQFSLAEVYLR